MVIFKEPEKHTSQYPMNRCLSDLIIKPLGVGYARASCIPGILPFCLEAFGERGLLADSCAQVRFQGAQNMAKISEQGGRIDH